MAGKVTMQFAADDARAIAKIQDLNKHIEAQEKKLKRVTSASKQAGKSGSKWMKGAIGDVKAMIAGYAGLQGGIQMATKALKMLREEQERAKESRSESFGAYGKLLQLSGGDRKRYKQLKNQANQLRMQYGIDQEMAGSLVFDTVSGGEKDAGLYGSLHGAISDPGTIAKAVIKAKRGFGAAETGSSRSLINKLSAASVQDVATIEDVGQEIARVSAASGKSGIGASDEETLAVLSTLITNFRNAEEGGVRTARLAQFFAKSGVKGGFVSGLTDQRFANLQGQDLIKAIPEIRAREGFIQARNNLQEIMTKTQRIDAAGRAAPGSDAVSALAGSVRDEFGDEIDARREQERLKILEENTFGVESNRREAAASRAKISLLNKNALTRLHGKAVIRAGEYAEASPEMIEMIGGAVGSASEASVELLKGARYGPLGVTKKILGGIYDLLKEQNDLLKEKAPSRQPAVGGTQ